MNYITEAKNIYMKGINDNKNIHSADKVVLKELIVRQFQIMAQYIGVAELITLRNKSTLNT
jgi:hypothetical protein